MKENTLFALNWLKAPKDVASLFPSAPRVGRAMAYHISDPANCNVIELGAGTGSITAELLQAGVPPERLILFEKLSSFAGFLRQRFPGVLTLEKDVQELSTALAEVDATKMKNIHVVISALPLLTMPFAVQKNIVEQAFDVMVPGGIFVQLTYMPFSPIPHKKLGLQGRVGKIIWQNIPPATLWCYRKK